MSGRIRTIKPEWLEDQRMARASAEARVMSVALLVIADDYGRGRADPMMLPLQVFPPAGPENFLASLRAFERAAAELVGMRYLAFYEVDGQRYFSIRNWEKHQKVKYPSREILPRPPADLFDAPERDAEQHRETLRRVSGESPEDFPSCEGESQEALPTIARVDHRPSTIDHRKDLNPQTGASAPEDSQDPDETEPAADPEPDPWGLTPPEAPPPEPSVEVFRHWERTLWARVSQRKAVATPKRMSRIRARLDEGFTVEDLCRVVDRVARSPWHLGQNPGGKTYIDFETIMPNREKVDGWLNQAAEPEPAQARMQIPDGVKIL